MAMHFRLYQILLYLVIFHTSFANANCSYNKCEQWLDYKGNELLEFEDVDNEMGSIQYTDSLGNKYNDIALATTTQDALEFMNDCAGKCYVKRIPIDNGIEICQYVFYFILLDESLTIREIRFANFHDISVTLIEKYKDVIIETLKEAQGQWKPKDKTSKWYLYVGRFKLI